MSNLTLYTKLETLSPDLKSEVNDFVDFLLVKSSSKKKTIVPKFGRAKDKVHLSENFGEPLEDLNEYK
jgi:hypothetical protein